MKLEPDASAYFAGGYEGRGEASVPLGFVNVKVNVNGGLEAGTGRLAKASVPLGFVNVNVKVNGGLVAGG